MGGPVVRHPDQLALHNAGIATGRDLSVQDRDVAGCIYPNDLGLESVRRR